MDTNDETIQTYENGVAKYNAAAIPNVEGSVKEWIDKSLKLIPKDGFILELGSAHGRDADYMERQGYTVQRSDAVEAFVVYMQSSGYTALFLNALKDNLGGPYDMIYANAVLLHFTENETVLVLAKVKKALTEGGVFSFSVKIGNGADWSNHKLDGRRFFTYWQEKPLTAIVENAGYRLVSISEETGHDNGDWLHVICRVI